MDALVRDLKKFDSRVGPISDWLEELEKRCVVSKVKDDADKIIVCGLYIGPAGKNAIRALPTGTTWADAKKLLMKRLADGTDEEEAWETLKKLSGKDKSLVDLGSEIEQLVKRAFPGKDSVQERQAIDAFLRAIEEPLAAEIQRMGHSKFEDVLKMARRLDKLPPPKAAGGMDTVMQKLQEMELKFDSTTQAMKESAQVHLATTSQPTRTEQRDRRRQPGNRTSPRQQPQDRPPNQRCFFCEQEGHFWANCPVKKELLQLRQATSVAQGPAIHQAASTQPMPQPGPSRFIMAVRIDKSRDITLRELLGDSIKNCKVTRIQLHGEFHYSIHTTRELWSTFKRIRKEELYTLHVKCDPRRQQIHPGTRAWLIQQLPEDATWQPTTPGNYQLMHQGRCYILPGGGCYGTKKEGKTGHQLGWEKTASDASVSQTLLLPRAKQQTFRVGLASEREVGLAESPPGTLPPRRIDPPTSSTDLAQCPTDIKRPEEQAESHLHWVFSRVQTFSLHSPTTTSSSQGSKRDAAPCSTSPSLQGSKRDAALCPITSSSQGS